MFHQFSQLELVDPKLFRPEKFPRKNPNLKRRKFTRFNYWLISQFFFFSNSTWFERAINREYKSTWTECFQLVRKLYRRSTEKSNWRKMYEWPLESTDCRRWPNANRSYFLIRPSTISFSPWIPIVCSERSCTTSRPIYFGNREIVSFSAVPLVVDWSDMIVQNQKVETFPLSLEKVIGTNAADM